MTAASEPLVALLVPELPDGATVAEAAQAYATAGLRPVVIHTPQPGGGCSCSDPECPPKRWGKHPRAASWQAGLGPGEVRQEWTRVPDANVGLCMGHGRLVALDIDGADGRASLANLEAQHGPLPLTATSATGRDGGGEHRLFLVPESLELGKLRNVVGRLAGLDMRATGGQIVAAPSLHASGKRYRWIRTGEVAELPRWLFDAMTAPKPPKARPPEVPRLPPAARSASSPGRPGAYERARAWLGSVPGAMAGQGGHLATFNAALGLVIGFQLPEGDALELLSAEFNPRCEPRWSDEELRHKVTDAAKNAGGLARGYLLNEDAPGFAPRAARGARSAPLSGQTHAPIEESAEPFLPLETPRDLPPFPLGALPLAMETFVSQLAMNLECPPDLPACLALGALASVCMKRFTAEPRTDWREPLNLYLAVALDPGESKSPAFRQVFAPLYALQKEMREGWKVDAQRVKDRNARKEKNEPEEAIPPCPRLFIDDATAEKTAAVLADHGERLTLASDEGTAFAQMCGLYSKNGQANVGVWLKSHDGGDLVVDRMGRDSIHLDSPLMTMALAVQPTVIRELAKRPDLRGRGLWSRFSFVFPLSRVGTRTFDTPPIDPRDRAGWHELVRGIARVPVPASPEVLRFSAEAYERLRIAMVEIDRAQVPGGALASVSDWASKLRGLIVRLAGLLHAADELAPEAVPVSADTIERALSIGRYLTAHSMFAFNIEMTLDPAEQAARAVWEVIQRKKWGRVTPREISRAIKALRKGPDALAALEVLAGRGYLTRDAAHHGHAYRVVERVSQRGQVVDFRRPVVDPLSTVKTISDSHHFPDNSPLSTASVDLAPTHAHTHDPSPPEGYPVDNGDKGDNGQNADVLGACTVDSPVDNPVDNQADSPIDNPRPALAHPRGSLGAPAAPPPAPVRPVSLPAPEAAPKGSLVWRLREEPSGSGLLAIAQRMAERRIEAMGPGPERDALSAELAASRDREALAQAPGGFRIDSDGSEVIEA